MPISKLNQNTKIREALGKKKELLNQYLDASPLIKLTLRSKIDDKPLELFFSIAEVLSGDNLKGLILMMMIEAGKIYVFDAINDDTRAETYY